MSAGGEVPVSRRLYLTVRDAAHYAGIGEGAMYDYVNGSDPPPLLVIGGRRYVQREGLGRYLEERQTWRYPDGGRGGTGARG